jgi:hypothetical protein
MDLFESSDLPEPVEKDLRVGGISSEEMIPQQKKFNKLVKRIEKLRQDVTER